METRGTGRCAISSPLRDFIFDWNSFQLRKYESGGRPLVTAHSPTKDSPKHAHSLYYLPFPTLRKKQGVRRTHRVPRSPMRSLSRASGVRKGGRGITDHSSNPICHAPHRETWHITSFQPRHPLRRQKHETKGEINSQISYFRARVLHPQLPASSTILPPCHKFQTRETATVRIVLEQ
jgi:hypothetical protein